MTTQCGPLMPRPSSWSGEGSVWQPPQRCQLAGCLTSSTPADGAAEAAPCPCQPPEPSSPHQTPPLLLPHCPAALLPHSPPCPRSQYRLPWAVNYTVVQPGDCRLLCTVGDDPAALVYDAASGRQVAALRGHSDYSFAAAWHPDGHVIATGNQVGWAAVGWCGCAVGGGQAACFSCSVACTRWQQLALRTALPS